MSGLNDKEVNIDYILNILGEEKLRALTESIQSTAEASESLKNRLKQIQDRFDEGLGASSSWGKAISNMATEFNDSQASIGRVAQETAETINRTTNFNIANAQRWANSMKDVYAQIREEKEKFQESASKIAFEDAGQGLATVEEGAKKYTRRKGLIDKEINSEELIEKYKDEYQQGLEKYLRNYLSPTEGISTYKIDAEKRKRIPEGEGPLGDLREVQRKEFFGISSKQIEDSAAFFQNIDKEQFSYETAQLANEKYKNIITNNNFAIGQGIKMAMEAPIPDDLYIGDAVQQKYKDMVKRTNDSIGQGIRAVIEAPIPTDLYDQEFASKKYKDMVTRSNDSIAQGIRMAIEAPIPDDLYISDFVQQKYMDMLSRTNDSIAQGIRMAIDSPIPTDLYDPEFASKKYKDMVNRSNDTIAQGLQSVMDAPIPDNLYDPEFASKNYKNMVERTNDTIAESFGKFMALDPDLDTLQKSQIEFNKLKDSLKSKDTAKLDTAKLFGDKSENTLRGEAVLGKAKGSWNNFTQTIDNTIPPKVKKWINAYKNQGAEADKSNKKFADWGKKFGFMGFILSFVIGRIASTINGFARTIFDFGTGLLSTDKATQAMIDNIVNVAMGGAEKTGDAEKDAAAAVETTKWTDRAVEGWKEWYAAARAGQAELGKFSILLMGPFAAAARGMTQGLSWMVKELEKLDIASLSGSIQAAFKIIAESIGGVVVSLVKTVIENKGSLEALAGFLGEFFKEFFGTIIGVAGLLVKLGPALKPLGGFLGATFAGITLLGQALSIAGSFANVLALFKIPGFVTSIGGVGTAASIATPILGGFAAAISRVSAAAGLGGGLVGPLPQVAQAATVSTITLVSAAATIAQAAILAIGVQWIVLWVLKNFTGWDGVLPKTGDPVKGWGETDLGKKINEPNIITDSLKAWGQWFRDSLGLKLPGEKPTIPNLPNVNPNTNSNQYGEGISEFGTSYGGQYGKPTPLSSWYDDGKTSGPRTQTISAVSSSMPSAPGLQTANFETHFHIQNFYANGLSDATDLSTSMGNDVVNKITSSGVSI